MTVRKRWARYTCLRCGAVYQIDPWSHPQESWTAQPRDGRPPSVEVRCGCCGETMVECDERGELSTGGSER